MWYLQPLCRTLTVELTIDIEMTLRPKNINIKDFELTFLSIIPNKINRNSKAGFF